MALSLHQMSMCRPNTNPISVLANEQLRPAIQRGTNWIFDIISNWQFDTSIFICLIIFFLCWFPELPPNPFIGLKLKKWLRNKRVGLSHLRVLGVFVIFALTCYAIDLLQKDSGDSLKPVDCLAILGTVLAIVAWREAALQCKEISDIANALPTRYLQTFPHHLRDIITMVENPKCSVKILVDCADYGSFSNPDDHKLFVEAIKDIQTENEKSLKEKRLIIEVGFRICGKRQHISRSSEFWERWQIVLRGGKGEWKEFLKQRDFQDTLDAYCLSNAIPPAIRLDKYNNFKDREDFMQLMTDKHNEVLDYWGLSHAEKQSGVAHFPHDHIEHLPGVFFWMKDDREAVFVLSHTRGGMQGMAFYTRDVQIIEILKTTWDSMDSIDKDGKFWMGVLMNNHRPSVTRFLTYFPPEKHDFIKNFLTKHKNGYTVK